MKGPSLIPITGWEGQGQFHKRGSAPGRLPGKLCAPWSDEMPKPPAGMTNLELVFSGDKETSWLRRFLSWPCIRIPRQALKLQMPRPHLQRFHV